MFFPCPAIGSRIQHNRLNIIHDFCKTGFGTLPGFKFQPQIQHLFCLILRQQIKNTICRFQFPLGLRGNSSIVICISIPCINFHNIVNQQHGYRFQHIKRFTGIFAQQNRHQCRMPRMFRIIFHCFIITAVSLAVNLFFFINFQRKLHLLFQTVHSIKSLRYNS